jgi:hypothetical protein
MSSTKDTEAEALRSARAATQHGNHLLAMGASVGAIGLAGAALGAVCPLCVVATPALLGVGVVQRLRGLVLARRARVANPAPGERLTGPVAGDAAALPSPHR